MGHCEQQSGGKDDWRHADRQKGKLIDAVEDQELRHARKQLPMSAVVWSRPLPLGPDGRHVFGRLDA